jgi:MoxR-like ATPase
MWRLPAGRHRWSHSAARIPGAASNNEPRPVGTVRLGGVAALRFEAEAPHLVPRGYAAALCGSGMAGDAAAAAAAAAPGIAGTPPLLGQGGGGNPELDQRVLRHLRWLLQKDALGQDVFLIGEPGPTRRRLAMLWAEVTGREVEYLPLSCDTTDADLKQRREIVDGASLYVDAPPVAAAVCGRVLVLDGIEKAERNVLPTLNNLLENREMALPDSSFLVAPERFDALLEGKVAAALGVGGGGGVGAPPDAVAEARAEALAELEALQLRRVSAQFRVVALGLPVPRFPGFPLDPPLRSRFQARSVEPGGTGGGARLARLTALLRGGGAGGAEVAAADAAARDLATRLLGFEGAVRMLVAAAGPGGGGGGAAGSVGGAAAAARRLLAPPDGALEAVAASVGQLRLPCSSSSSSSSSGGVNGGDGGGGGGGSSSSVDAALRRVYPYHLFGLEPVAEATLGALLSRYGLGLANASTATEQKVGAATHADAAAAAEAPPAPLPPQQSHALAGQLGCPASVMAVHDAPADAMQKSVRIALPSTCCASDGGAVAAAAPTVVELSVAGGALPGELPAAAAAVAAAGQQQHFHQFTATSGHEELLGAMVADHAAGRDLCLVGGKGQGKTAIAHAFARMLGYSTQTLQLYRDMTTRDLWQRRATDERGNTRWSDSALLDAAEHGQLLLLDGVQQLRPDALAGLAQLLQDREASGLAAGGRLLSAERFDALAAAEAQQGGGVTAGPGGSGGGGGSSGSSGSSRSSSSADGAGGEARSLEEAKAALRARGVRRVHPSFRVLALGTPPEQGGASKADWLSAETLGMFAFHDVPALGEAEAAALLLARHPELGGSAAAAAAPAAASAATATATTGGGMPRLHPGLEAVFRVQGALEALREGDVGAASSSGFSLSLRQMQRLGRGLVAADKQAAQAGAAPAWQRGLRDEIERVCLVPFMSPALRQSFEGLLADAGIERHATNATSTGVDDATAAVDMLAPELVVRAATAADGSLLGGGGGGYGGRVLDIGGVLLPVNDAPANPELVPDASPFVQVPEHSRRMRAVLADWAAGERHQLLIGNQGTGKNKIADRLLQLLGWEREYIQLHRDTSVASLTVNPTLKGGVVVWEDSPLVKAVTQVRMRTDCGALLLPCARAPPAMKTTFDFFLERAERCPSGVLRGTACSMVKSIARQSEPQRTRGVPRCCFAVPHLCRLGGRSSSPANQPPPARPPARSAPPARPPARVGPRADVRRGRQGAARGGRCAEGARGGRPDGALRRTAHPRTWPARARRARRRARAAHPRELQDARACQPARLPLSRQRFLPRVRRHLRLPRGGQPRPRLPGADARGVRAGRAAAAAAPPHRRLPGAAVTGGGGLSVLPLLRTRARCCDAPSAGTAFNYLLALSRSSTDVRLTHCSTCVPGPPAGVPQRAAAGGAGERRGLRPPRRRGDGGAGGRDAPPRHPALRGVSGRRRHGAGRGGGDGGAAGGWHGRRRHGQRRHGRGRGVHRSDG